MIKCTSSRYAGERVRDYDLSAVKERLIPTYVHEQIFMEATPDPIKKRYTATYRSNMFKGDYYHHKNTNKLSKTCKKFRHTARREEGNRSR